MTRKISVDARNLRIMLAVVGCFCRQESRHEPEQGC
jgi:hypothetical protein